MTGNDARESDRKDVQESGEAVRRSDENDEQIVSVYKHAATAHRRHSGAGAMAGKKPARLTLPSPRSDSASASAGARRENNVLSQQAAVLQEAPSPVASGNSALSEDWQERRSRNELRRVEDLGVQRPDAQQVEYRRVRLERVLLVGIWNSQETTYARARDSLRELAALATTAGASVLDGFLQQRPAPDPATYLGSGKAKQLARLVDEENADTIIVNTELPPSQRRAREPHRHPCDRPHGRHPRHLRPARP